MSSPSQEYFFPLSVENFTHMARMSKKTVTVQVIGSGTVLVGKKERRFFIVRIPIGDGTTGRFPVFVPERVVHGIQIEMIKGHHMTFSYKNGGAEIKVSFDKKKSKGSIIVNVMRRDGNSGVPCREYVIYKKVGKEWIPTKCDGIDM